MDFLTTVIVLLPLVAALGIFLGAPARRTALGSAVISLIATVLACGLYDPEGERFQFVTHWLIYAPWEWYFSLGVDGLSLALVALCALVTLAAVVVPAAPKSGHKLFYGGVLLISAGAMGAFCARDLFFFYAFHELALIPTFLLIALHGHGVERRSAAWKITIYLSVGSVVLLIGLIALVVAISPERIVLDMGAIEVLAREAGLPLEVQSGVFLLLLLGFGILVSLFPFHSWAAPAYAAAPTPVAMLHAGVLKKFGLYGLLRLAWPLLPEGAAHWENLVLAMLVGNVLVIGLVTVAQSRLDRMLGYSSVMHMGYIFLGLVAGNVWGWQGATMLLVAHGLSIALLFALAGYLREQGVVDLELRGLAHRAPFLGGLFGVAAFASIGLPGLANFVGELLVFLGVFWAWDLKSGWGWMQTAGILCLWGVVLSAVYMLRAYRNLFWGELQGEVAEMAWPLRLPLVLLALVLALLGVFPQLLFRWF